MSDCPTPSRRIALIQSLLARMRSLKCIWDRVALITGWVPDTRTVYAPLQSKAYSGGMWSVTWLSTPGRFYSLQQSGDAGLTWLTVAVAVPAEASPSKTTSWVSPVLPPGDLFFRIVVLPEGFAPCYTAEGISNIPGWNPALDPLASLS